MSDVTPEGTVADAEPRLSSFLRDIIAEDVHAKKDRGKVALPPIHRP